MAFRPPDTIGAVERQRPSETDQDEGRNNDDLHAGNLFLPNDKRIAAKEQ